MGSVVRSTYRLFYREVGAARTSVAWALQPVWAFKREENFLPLLGKESQFLVIHCVLIHYSDRVNFFF